MTPRRRFWHVAGAGTAFQAGSAAVDSGTVMSALVFQLTGSTIAVGAVSTILRLGWLLPQLFVGYLAGRGASSMPFYIVGAFGRTAAIALLAIVLWTGAVAGWSDAALGAATLGLWVLYAFLSGSWAFLTMTLLRGPFRRNAGAGCSRSVFSAAAS